MVGAIAVAGVVNGENDEAIALFKKHKVQSMLLIYTKRTWRSKKSLTMSSKIEYLSAFRL